MLPQKLDIVVSYPSSLFPPSCEMQAGLVHMWAIIRDYCLCGLGNSRRCNLALYVPRALFVGDAFSENVFRCATASRKAFLCGNPKEKGKRSLETFLGPSFRIQLENLSPCMWFAANSSWSAHPKQEYMHFLELHFQNFLSLLTLFSPLINFNAYAFSQGGGPNCNRKFHEY